MRAREKAGLALRAVGAAVIAGSVVVCLAAVITFASAAIGGLIAITTAEYVLGAFGLTWSIIDMLLLGAAGGIVLGGGYWTRVVRAARRDGRERLLDGATDPSDEHTWLVSTVERLAKQADIASPEVRLVEADTPLAYTVPRSGRPALVVSTATIETLPADELEAVLAHELAHLANGDLRLMGLVMTPLIAAEEFVETYRVPDPRAVPWLALGLWHELWARIAVGLFSRGREFAADRAAATLTGNPAALALALKRLDVTIAETPTEDLRQPDRSTDALSILPALDPNDGGGGLLATHPSTEDRIDRLRELVREQEGV